MTRIFAAALIAMSLLAATAEPAQAKVMIQDERGFVTRAGLVVDATPYEAWQMLVQPEDWWSDTHTWSGKAANLYLSAQAGGCFCELLDEQAGVPEGIQRGSSRHMTVVQADPPRVLRMRGGLGPLQSEPVDGVLTITLKEVPGGTRILFEYVVGGYFRFDVATISKAVDMVMNEQLARLGMKLGVVTPEPSGAGEGSAANDDSDEKSKARSAGENGAATNGKPGPAIDTTSPNDVGSLIDAMADD
ncbi:hypothetical protein HME9302_01466 [Alteripontixanthobacter maritimus]|uniref:Uncharacterized protein n=1 Tax=Alteripontixanthobacter maritimus TaxID=2161824 RepID=A0A369Q9N4_9SPHN|nr:SRPBCC family protein [Alteripontixanthobacter maritimus]RDC60265.1 hypothetical protein HME9302_01466 [Alteripontixanthobacter maritimus]